METVFMTCREIGGSEVPAEIQVVPYGFHRTPKGDFLCDEESAALVLGEFERQKNDMVLDYEHQTLSGGEAPAAGWIKSLVNKGKDGIWAVIEWTDRAKHYVVNREYRYVSPVFLKRLSDNKVVRLINVALTNQPNIDGMVPIVNKGAYQPSTDKKEVHQMKRIFALLGLAEEATEDQVIEAVNKLKAPVVMAANKAVLDALGLKEGAPESEITGTIMAMTQSHAQTGDLAKKVSDLEKNLRERDAKDLVAMAMKDGKVTADQKDWAMKYAETDPEGFRVFAAKAPQVVPMGTINKGVDGPRDASIDDAQAQVNRMLGISEDIFKKHNPKEA